MSNLRRWFGKVFFQPAPIAWSVIAGTFFIIGILFWGGLHTAMSWTDSVEFCVTCHSMETAYKEYKNSRHYQNVSGVRAICTDCHVPKPWHLYVQTKIKATKDVWGELIGVIDTKEKYETHRLDMAQSVWVEMERNDSITCRNCHAFKTMLIDDQRSGAKKQHPKAMTKGETCISCHKGLVHKMPDMGSLAKVAYENFKDTIGVIKPGQLVARSLATDVYFLDEAAQEKAGKILPGAPLEVVALSGKMVQIRIEGWRQQDVERVLYAEAGKRVLFASLNSEAQAMAQPHGDPITIEETGQIWQKASIKGWVPLANLTGATDKLWDYAGALYTANCALCHAAPHLNEFNANQWSGQFKSMVDSSNLLKEEARLVLTYLQLHASDMGQDNTHH